MEFIKLQTLSLHTFDKENKSALEFIKKLCKDETIQTRFQGITSGLLHNEKKDFFNHSFLVTDNNVFIGYINIGTYNKNEKCVFLRAAIDKDNRGKSYGRSLLNEATDYIFKTYPEVESIRLKIAIDNKASLMTAKACEYEWLENDFYIKYNPYINKKRKY